MPGKTKIEWATDSWNPVTGCTQLSPGCDCCYALTFAERWRGVPGHPYEQGFDLKLWPERLNLPLTWKKPRIIFVNSMSDLFHEAIPEDYIRQVFDVMGRADWHIFQVLTKRPSRMAELAPSLPWPKHIWAGTTVELDRYAWRANKYLAQVPAAVRFVSAEPLLGPLPSLKLEMACAHCDGDGIAPPALFDFREVPPHEDCPRCRGRGRVPLIDWLIAGGESGHGARPMHPDWARDLRDRCTAAGVKFFFKQWGEWAPSYFGEDREPRDGMANHYFDDPPHKVWRFGKKAAGRLLDGRAWDEMPATVAPELAHV